MIGRCLEIEDLREHAWKAWGRALELDAKFKRARLDLAKSLLLEAVRVRGIPTARRTGAGEVEMVDPPPESPKARELREEAAGHLELLEPAGLDEAERSLLEGLILLVRLDLAQAALRLRPYAVREKWNVWIVLLWGCCLLASRDFPNAEDAFTLALRFGRTWYLHLYRGISRYGQGDRTGAIEDCTESARIHPVYSGTFGLRAAAYKEQGDLVRAEQDYGAQIAIQEDFDVREARGRIRIKLGKFREAIVDLALAVEARETAVRRGLLGRARMLAGELSAARADLDRSLELEPDVAPFLLDRASVKYRFGLHQEAVADFDRAIGLDATQPIAYANRGLAYEALGEIERARSDYRKALEIAPKAWEPRESVEKRLAGLN